MTETVFGASETTHHPSADLTGDDLLDETGDGAYDETDTEESDGPAAKSSGSQRGLSRAQIRRIAAKAQEVAETEERVRSIAGSLVSSGTGIAELTTAIMAADRSVSQPIGDLTMIAESEPMEAGINAAALGRPRLKNVWALLAALDAGPKGNMPSADAKAALAVTKAIFALDEIAKAELASVVALLKKN